MNKNDIMNILKEAVPCVFISAQEPLAELTDYGVVTGYSVIGTGPISEFLLLLLTFLECNLVVSAISSNMLKNVL